MDGQTIDMPMSSSGIDLRLAARHLDCGLNCGCSPVGLPMPKSELPSRVHYTITPTETGVNLCIWETAQVTEARIKPFLFKIRHRLANDTEAQQVLREYLANLGVC